MVGVPISRRTMIVNRPFTEFVEQASERLAEDEWLLSEERTRQSAEFIITVPDPPLIGGLSGRSLQPITRARLVMEATGRDRVTATLRVGVEPGFIPFALVMLSIGVGAVVVVSRVLPPVYWTCSRFERFVIQPVWMLGVLGGIAFFIHQLRRIRRDCRRLLSSFERLCSPTTASG